MPGLIEPCLFFYFFSSPVVCPVSGLCLSMVGQLQSQAVWRALVKVRYGIWYGSPVCHLCVLRNKARRIGGTGIGSWGSRKKKK